MAATPATAALEAAGVDFTTTEYELPTDADGYGDGVVEVLGLDPATVGKTLVAMVDERAVVAVVPVAGSLDLKALARAAGAKRATMADHADAERLSGSVVGGIAPLGHRTRLAVFIDASFLDVEKMHVSGGRRGLEVTVAPDALVSACGATVAPIAR
ncbi:YbaK/EbsC family protein [Actinospongicola halichondriae]|uniref:YbaK/EbsC family protein n=1 Tax=Actinospongicola halichondriae TaxID=3236844 RepID=UPI003D4B80B4